MDNSQKIVFNQNGYLLSLVLNNIEFIKANHSESLFIIQLRDFIGSPFQLSARDFRNVEISEADESVQVVYSECPRLPGTMVIVYAVIKENSVDWQIRVELESNDYSLEWADYPRLVLKANENTKTLLPYAEGTLVSNLKTREEKCNFRCEYSEYPLTGLNNFYPGPAAMQFEAVYDNNSGLYIGCEDPTHSPKTIDAMSYGDDGIILMIQSFTGGDNKLSYAVKTSSFDGDWQTAAEIYRVFLEKSDPFLPAKLSERMPDWLRKSPIILAYAVKGNGSDHGDLSPNEFYPYINALPTMEKYQKIWDNPVMGLLMHWEGTAPWAPPFVWPPFGGEDELKKYVDAMHEKGNTVGLYCSGIAWTQRSMIDHSYSLEKRFAEDNVAESICIGPRGETWSRVCNNPMGQRLGFDLCPETDYTHKVVTDEVSSAAKLGVDYMQYFDQNLGCSAPFCYSKNHNHPNLPGSWHTESMRKLLFDAQKAADKTILGCENGAAEPYMEVCMLNDLRNHLAWGAGGKPVPLYPYLFHEYVCGFSGNGCSLSAWVDLKKTPYILHWIMAWNFVNGNLLSPVLKEKGEIYWHWNLLWDRHEKPEQESLIELIDNLSEWRRTLAKEFLIDGRMEICPKIECEKNIVYLKQNRTEEIPAIESAVWSNSKGEKVLFLVNYSDCEIACQIDFKGISVSRPGNEQRFDGGIITVPKFDAIMVKLKIK